MRVLLAEDDTLLGDGLRAGLRQLGFQIDWVRDGEAAERELRAEPYAAAVLDLGLPRLDGLDVLARVRTAGITVPVLVLTARDAVPDRIRGLDQGADDYIVKPIDLHDLVLDPAARSVQLGTATVALSVREFDLLHALLLAAGRVLTREQLEQQLYAWGQEVESNTVEVHVHHLRRKLRPDLIHTVRGVGYCMPR